MRVAFITFGCRLNRAEALTQEAQYAALGHTVITLKPSAKADDASFMPDMIIVRGCSVTAKAQRECEKTIAHLRERFKDSKIVIAGCLPDADDSSEAAKPAKPALNMSTSRAYLKVQDGCSGKCAFCIVPKFRGPPRSVDFNEVLDQARAFLTAGFRELVVTGCNLILYRSCGHDLSSLVQELARLEVDGQKKAHRVRLGSIEPNSNLDKLLEVMGANSNICRFIHLSVQSGSDKILKLMRRPYTASQVQAFAIKARRVLGDRLALGADIITGFPGESEEDFAQTCALMAGNAEAPAFVNLHVFPYSERPGTPAATMPGQVPRDVRIKREKELSALGHTLRCQFAASFIGQSVQVCVEKSGNGRTQEYLYAKLPPGFTRRQLVDVRVSAVDGDSLTIA